MVTRIEKNKKQRTDLVVKEHIENTKNVTLKIVKILSVLLAIITITYITCRYVGTSGLIVKEYSLEYDNLPKSFYGTKIVQISDINYDDQDVNMRKIKRLVKRVNSIRPDIIIFTGDLIHGNMTSLEMDNLEKNLSKLTATLGKYAVFGEEDDDNSHIIIKNAGFIDLDNSYDLVYKNSNEPFLITGINSQDMDLEKSFDYFKKDDEKDIFTIAIMHKPDVITEILNYHQVDLAMAGHSLNGLIKLPKIGGIFTFDGSKKYFDSYYQIDRTDLYVSGGIGTREYHYRLFNHPSINLYRLK